MLRTSDGYAVTMPRFRARRLARRLAARAADDLQRRAAARLIGTLVERARCASRWRAACPRFVTRLGRQRLVLVTRARAPGRVELLYIGRLP